MTRHPIGCLCKVYGLKRSTELNGRVVTIIGYHDEEGWHETDARAEEEVVSVIHVSNLRRVDGLHANTVTSWEHCPFQPEREVVT